MIVWKGKKNSFLDFSIYFKFCKLISYDIFGINWHIMFCLEVIKMVSLGKYYVNAWDINEAKSKGVGLSQNKKCEKIPDLSTNKIVTD